MNSTAIRILAYLRLLRNPTRFYTTLTVILLMSAGCATEDTQEEDASEEEVVSFIHAAEAENFPGFEFQGEYSGNAQLSRNAEPVEAGLQVAVEGENQFRAILYMGGLPGRHLDHGDGEFLDIIELEGTYEDQILHLQSEDSPISVRKVHEHFAVLDEEYNYLGHLDPVRRSSSTAGLAPPEEATVLFSGLQSELEEHWRDGAVLDGGELVQGATTRAEYGDIRLHLEVRIGLMPYTSANSGIYIQNRYEVQILDSFASLPHSGSNAALYQEATPLFNPTFPPLDWQTYDVYFRAPRFDDQGEKTENVRITIYLNGFLVVDDEELEQGTGAGGQREEIAVAETYLQDHTGQARFRNIWLVEEDYSPPGTRKLMPEQVISRQ